MNGIEWVIFRRKKTLGTSWDPVVPHGLFGHLPAAQAEAQKGIWTATCRMAVDSVVFHDYP